jgi:hypothetical protein
LRGENNARARTKRRADNKAAQLNGPWLCTPPHPGPRGRFSKIRLVLLRALILKISMNRPPGYNAKARGSIAGGSRKSGKAKAKRSKAAASASASVSAADANADVLQRKTEEERERDRKDRMIQEVCVAAQLSV